MALVSKNRVAILVVGIVTLLMYGIIYAWSIFIPPLEQEFGWSRSSTSLVFSVAMVGLSLGMLSVGQLAKRFSLRRCFEFAMVLVPAGLVACQFITQLWQLYVVYGVVCGIGCGIAYTSWTKHVISWFGDKVGLASGLLVMGFGMGALVLGGIAARLIYSPVGWRWTLLSCIRSTMTLALNYVVRKRYESLRFGFSACGEAPSWGQLPRLSPRLP